MYVSLQQETIILKKKKGINSKHVFEYLMLKI